MISQPAREPAALPEARIADRYALESLLGQGGMGAVYAALDEATGKRVALKRLLGGANTKSSALFEREYQTLASLRHPAIVEVYDYGRDAAGAYYTMEIIDGVDLSKQAPLPWREACACLRDVASILGLLHARKLVHRDLSPRNLLRSSGGRLKLIDFGALASFGVSKETVGTPPFVPPEALDTAELDQRSDLFALGALGYWLITGTHAFPARSLRDLPRLWERAPALPSSLVALLGEERLGTPPAALDELIVSLLRVAPAERPSNTTELIDRLNVIADLEPEAEDHAVEGYLNSKVLVGRARERERVLGAIAEVESGHGQALLIEGEPGLGRTRLVNEASVLCRLAGMATLSVDAAEGDRPYAAAERLCLQALDALPELAREAMAKDAPVLGRLSGALHARLGGGALAASSGTPGEDRARAQLALHTLFLALSQERSLALLVDDLQGLDDESQALLAGLAHGCAERKLLLLASATRDGAHEPSAAALSYRQGALRMHLLPLNASETLELLHALFGSVSYLERLAERLHRVSEGSPAYCLELAEHLVRSGLVRYEEGSWVLPAELAADSLPASRHAGYLARIDRLSRETRSLARLLSVPHHGVLTHAECTALADPTAQRSELSLTELVRQGVLRETPHGYHFVHIDLQRALQEELTPSERKRAHRCLGEAVLAGGAHSHQDELRAAVHFLRAELPRRAYPLIKNAANSFTGAALNSSLRIAAPLLEEIYQLLEARGADLYACSEPLAVLALAGYFIDRRYAARYGEKAVETLTILLKLKLARALSRVLGNKLALIVTLIVAGIGLRLRSKRGPTLPIAIRRLLSACSALAGTAAVTLDPDRAEQLASVIEPFRALGPDHAATIVHRFTKALSYTVRDRLALCNAEMRALLARLESPTPIKGLEEGIRMNYVAGCYFALGTNVARQQSTEVLTIANRLEQFSPLYALSADRLREEYYGDRGYHERADFYRKRVELHAVQLGSAWQVETWEPANTTERALRAQDAMLMKRAVQELVRLSHEIPSLKIEAERARGTYLMLRGKYAQAIPLLEQDVASPLAIIGWTRARGSVARCHNALGDHARALAVGREALSHLTPEDLSYPIMNLTTQIEVAHAEAGLLDFATARARLDSLLAQFGSADDALTVGLLHQAYARVALRQGDLATARVQLDKLAAQYRPLGLPSLLQALASLTREVERAERPTEMLAGGAPRLLDDADHLMTRVQLVLSHANSTLLTERANRGLQIALELSSADEGFVVLQNERAGGELHLGNPPSPELVAWAREQLLAASVDEQTVMTEEVSSEIDSNYLVIGRMRYCAATLTARVGTDYLVIGTLVLGFDNRVPRMPQPEVLAMIADHLRD